MHHRTIKPVREQPEPAAAPAGRTKKKPDRKKAEEPPPTPLKPPKKEREKKSPVGKPKKTASPPKAQPAAVIAETVGSFLVRDRAWLPSPTGGCRNHAMSAGVIPLSFALF